MNKDHVSILSESDNARIVKFQNCGHIGVMHKNILLYFSPKNYMKFAKKYEGIDFSRHSLLFPDDQKRMIINTPVPDVQFCFTKSEFEQFKYSLMEASILVDAHALINEGSA